MTLATQPYFPLYIDNWMNNSQLKVCSPAAHGILISILCLLHKENNCGTLMLKQKFKLSKDQTTNFALQIAKLTAFDLHEIENPLIELVAEGILIIQDDYLIYEPMFREEHIHKKEVQKELMIAPKKEITIKEPEKIDFEKIVSIFNSVCNKLPAVQKLTIQRKSAIKNRITDSGLSGLGDAFQKVAQSRFLNGENERGWTADFDWILKPANFIKIIEGKYKNTENGNNKSSEQIFTAAMDSEVGRDFKFK
jgi:hypothetical protein